MEHGDPPKMHETTVLLPPPPCTRPRDSSVAPICAAAPGQERGWPGDSRVLVPAQDLLSREQELFVSA